MRTSTTTSSPVPIRCSAFWRGGRAGEAAGRQEHLKPAGVGRGEGGSLQEDHLLETGHRRVTGGGVYRVAGEDSRTDCPGRGHHGSAVARPAGGAILPRLLRQLLLPAALHLLRGAGSLRSSAAIQPRRLCGEPGGDSTDRQANPRGVAGSEDHLAWGLWFLPERVDELVRR